MEEMNDEDLLRAKLNAETGQLVWKELERHFARGVVLRLAPGLDLVEVALAMHRDDKAQIAAWMQSGELAEASTEEAIDWHARDPLFWAIVIAPWVLVQERQGTDNQQ